MSLHPPHPPSPAPTPENSLHQNPNSPQSQKAIRDELDARLYKLSEDLRELEICAAWVVAGQEHRVPQLLMEINESYLILNDLAKRATDSVPRNVVESIDQYKNPHMFTKTTLLRATGENQYALGRILGLESFRRQLEDSIGQEFPGVPLPPRRHQPIKESPARPDGAEPHADGVKEEVGQEARQLPAPTQQTPAAPGGPQNQANGGF